MRKLHVVGFTTDHDGLIFSTRKGSKSGSFVVAISDELLDKVAEAERLRNGGETSAGSAVVGADRSSRRDDRDERRTRPESNLTPREIQSRLRAGRTIDEVAKEARVDHEWVERFAAPILAEQAQIVELAQSLTFEKPRRGESPRPLGDSVAINLVDRGLRMLEDEFDRAWSAYQVHDGVWIVRFRYRSRGRPQQATWELDVAGGRLISRDRLGSDLGYVDRSRRRRVAPRPAEAVDAAADGTPIAKPASAPAARRKRPTTAKPRARVTRPPRKVPGRTPARAVAKKSPAAKATGARTASTGRQGATVKRPATPRAAKKRPAAAPPTAPTAKKASRSPNSAKAAEPARVPRPLPPRPPSPRFGTDGSVSSGPTVSDRLSARTIPKAVSPKAVSPKAVSPKAVSPKAVSPKAVSPKAVSPKAVSPKAVSTPTAVPKAARSSSAKARPAGTAAARSPASGPLGVSGRGRSSGTANGLAPPRRNPPLQVPRKVDPPPSTARPVISPEPPAEPRIRTSPPRRAALAPRPPAPRPAPEIEVDLDFDDDLDALDTVGRTPAPPSPPPPLPPRAVRRKGGDDGGKTDPPAEDAFVIRPRISARQASELAFSDTPGSQGSPSFS